MSEHLVPSSSHGGPDATSGSARARGPIANDAERIDAQLGTPHTDANGGDVDAVEQLRQDRLRRWQTPPNPTRRAR